MGDYRTPRPDRTQSTSEFAAFTDHSSLGDRIDFAVFLTSAGKTREAQGLMQSEFAERMGVDHVAVSRLESGERANPTVNTVMRYVEAIGLRVARELAERDDATVTPPALGATSTPYSAKLAGSLKLRDESESSNRVHGTP